MTESRNNHIADVAKIVKRVKKGDKTAFRLLYDKTWQPIFYMLVKKTGDEGDAAILLNEVFVSVFIGIGKLDNDMAYYKWIAKIADNTYKLFLRSNKTITSEELHSDSLYYENESEDDDEFIPHAALEKKEYRQAIIKMVDELPPKQREAIFMYYYMDMKTKEIADATDTPENTVKNRIRNGKISLKNKFMELKEKGVILYNMSGLYVLRELFQEDMMNYADSPIKAMVWQQLTCNILVAAAQKNAASFAFKTAVSKLTLGGAAAGVSAVIAFSPPFNKEDVTQVTPQVSSAYVAPSHEPVETYKQEVMSEPIEIVLETADEVNESPPPIPYIQAQEEFAPIQTDSEVERVSIEVTPTPAGYYVAQIQREAVTARIPLASSNDGEAQVCEPVSITVSHSYEINEGPDESGLIKDISTMAGNVFDAKDSSVKLVRNEFDAEKLGEYHVEIEVGDKIRIFARISVIDTIAPEIIIANREIIYPKGEEISLEKIIEDAEVVIRDNSGEEIIPIAQGYERINFHKEGGYHITLKAYDSGGNTAMQEMIFITIK